MDYNGSTLAYIGDAVLSLQVREYLVEKGITKAKDLLQASIVYVSAVGQHDFMIYLLANKELNGDELVIYKRGRNHKSSSIAKNADVVTYRVATGLEALWGHWHLTKQTERLNEMWTKYRDFVEKSPK